MVAYTQNNELPNQVNNTFHHNSMAKFVDTILLNEGVDRTKFLKFLNSEGIGASVHFDPPVHMQPYYKKGDFDKSNLEVTEDVARRIVTLPMFPSIFPEQLIYVVEKVKEGVYKSKNRNVLK